MDFPWNHPVRLPLASPPQPALHHACTATSTWIKGSPRDPNIQKWLYGLPGNTTFLQIHHHFWSKKIEKSCSPASWSGIKMDVGRLESVQWCSTILLKAILKAILMCDYATTMRIYIYIIYDYPSWSVIVRIAITRTCSNWSKYSNYIPSGNLR